MPDAAELRGGLADARWGRHPALVLAHPGHELLLHGWLEQARPVVFVLTDGSGWMGRPRLPSTRAVLDRAGARPGAIFGRWSDADLHALILEGRTNELRRLVDDLVAELVALGTDLVAGDALEGYNPGHDLTRYVVNAVARRMATRHSRKVRNYEFLLTRPAPAAGDDSLLVRLDDAAFARKQAAAGSYEDLQNEVALLAAGVGPDVFRVERLLAVDPEAALSRFDEATPFYETWGARRVAEGRYAVVIRYREHVRPLARALWTHAHDGEGPAS